MSRAYKVNYEYQKTYAPPHLKPVPAVRRPIRKPKRNPFGFIKTFVWLCFMAFIGLVVLPQAYNQITKPIFLNPFFEKPLKFDYYEHYRPTLSYLNNNHFLGQNQLQGRNIKKPQMQSLYEATTMNNLEFELAKLSKSYPMLQSSIFVWDYDNGNYVDINASKAFPAASIIKIPVLLELFKFIDSSSDISLNDKLTLTNANKASGSGSLQLKPVNTIYSIDYLAGIMMQESDNSATNMILERIGGKVALNRALRDWGMKSTYIENWLPDLEGENLTTSKEIATMLYNIDNSGFLSNNATDKIIEYMSNVHNDRLIPAGLEKGDFIIHKTGDIGTMLGDAGIVTTANGKKYIVVMLVKRPYNSPLGKDFIVKASKLINRSFQ